AQSAAVGGGRKTVGRRPNPDRGGRRAAVLASSRGVRPESERTGKTGSGDRINADYTRKTVKIDCMRRFFVVLLALPAFAQPQFTAADYQRAEKAMTYNTAPLVYRSGVRPNWLPDERFWYRVTTPEGAEFVLVDPAKGTRAPAFDHVKLAA